MEFHFFFHKLFFHVLKELLKESLTIKFVTISIPSHKEHVYFLMPASSFKYVCYFQALISERLTPVT